MNPKEVMERLLKDFACLTIGETVAVNHENQSYCIEIVEAMPKNAVSLHETDCELEFEKPLDHKEPEKIKQKDEEVEEVTKLEKDALLFKPFSGVSRRLDGQVSATPVVADEDNKKLVAASIKRARTVGCSSDENYSAAKKKAKKEVTQDKIFQPFTGKKYTLSSC